MSVECLSDRTCAVGESHDRSVSSSPIMYGLRTVARFASACDDAGCSFTPLFTTFYVFYTSRTSQRLFCGPFLFTVRGRTTMFSTILPHESLSQCGLTVDYYIYVAPGKKCSCDLHGQRRVQRMRVRSSRRDYDLGLDLAHHSDRELMRRNEMDDDSRDLVLYTTC